MPTQTATAVWEGGLRGGTGRYEAASGAFTGQYTFATRFEGRSGTSPEELIAAAHAACLSMALSGGLERAGTSPASVSVRASCSVDKVGEGFRITTMHLEVRGKVPGIDQAAFQKAAEAAKEGCPVSGALKGNVALTLDARLE